MLDALERIGYRHVGWDVDPNDWEPGRTAAELVERVRRRRMPAHGDGGRGAACTLAGRDAGGAARADRTAARRRRRPRWGSRAWLGAGRAGRGRRQLEAGRGAAQRAADGCWEPPAGAAPASRPTITTDSFAAPRRARSPGRAAAPASLPAAARSPSAAVLCLAGADLPVDDRRLSRSAARPPAGAERVVLRNDTFAVLRAGTERTWGVGVVCGTGLNCAAVSPQRPDRALRRARRDLGRRRRRRLDGPAGAAGGHPRPRRPRAAAPRSSSAVPAHFGLRTPQQLMEAIYLGTIDQHRLTELPRLVCPGSRAGDARRPDIVDRLADEIVAMVASALRRLRMTRRDSDVVLGRRRRPRPRPAAARRASSDGVTAVAPDARVQRASTRRRCSARRCSALTRSGRGERAYAELRAALTARPA